MIKTLTKHEDGWALIIDQAMLDELEINPTSQLSIQTEGRAMIVTPVQDADRKAKFDDALKAINEQYSDALKRLAE